MTNFPFFYAKIDVPLLRSFCAGGLSFWELQPFRLRHVGFPQPERQFTMEMRVVHATPFPTILRTGLNPRYLRFNTNTLKLTTGVLSKLEGQNGCWCMSTPCAQCLERVMTSSTCGEECGDIDCSTTNCSNNRRFRYELTQQGRIILLE